MTFNQDQRELQLVILFYFYEFCHFLTKRIKRFLIFLSVLNWTNFDFDFFGGKSLPIFQYDKNEKKIPGGDSCSQLFYLKKNPNQ